MIDAPGEFAEFHRLALGFCAWCEDESSPPSKKQAAQWLARLYAAALDLPETECDSEWGLPEIPAREHAAAERNLRAFSGWYYRTIFDPEPTNADEPVMGDVGDDLLDTYKDVKAGCLLLEQGRVPDALWHWSFMHRIHWGKHAVGALSALYARLRHDAA